MSNIIVSLFFSFLILLTTDCTKKDKIEDTVTINKSEVPDVVSGDKSENTLEDKQEDESLYKSDDMPEDTGENVSNNSSIIKLIVASCHADCVGVDTQACLLVKTDYDREWNFLYCSIEGFDFEEGYEYVLDVKLTPVNNAPADSCSDRYTLEKVVSKEKKRSENLPDWLK